jgi:hypothetical protein
MQRALNALKPQCLYSELVLRTRVFQPLACGGCAAVWAGARMPDSATLQLASWIRPAIFRRGSRRISINPCKIIGEGVLFSFKARERSMGCAPPALGSHKRSQFKVRWRKETGNKNVHFQGCGAWGEEWSGMKGPRRCALSGQA